MTTLSTVPVKPVFAFFILLGIQLFVPNKVSAQCDQCIDDNIMVFDARVDVSQPVSDHDSINTWLGLFWTARVARYWSHYMDPNKDCFFWVDGGMYLANEYQGGTLRFDETYTNVPPPGPLTATPYLLTGSLTSAAGPKQYTFTWQLECGTSREVVKSTSVVFTADSTGDVNIAGRTAASALQPLLRTIQDFEIQKREGDVGVARGGGGNTDAKITVTPARTQLDPNDTTDVELEMIDCDGYQLKNREIILEEFVDSTLGRFPGAVGGTISPTRVTTDVYGKAHVTFKAGAKSGVGIINAAYIFRKPHGWKYALTGNAVLNLAPNMWEVTASYEHIYTTTTDYTSTSTMDGVTTTQKGSSYWRASGRLHCVYENLNPQNAGFDTLVVYVFDNSQTTPDGITHGLSFQGNGVDMSTYREEIRDIKTGNLLGGDYSADQTSGTSGDSSSVYLYFSKEEIGFMDCFEMDASLHDIGWSASKLSPLQSQISHNPINQWSKEIGGELINSFYPGAFFSFSSDSNFSFNYTANKVQNTPDKGSSSNDIQAIKAQFNHKRVPTGIKSKTSSLLPDKFKLFQNFPNPFNPSTTIEFSLPRSVFVDLKVFNFLGQEVALLVSKELVAGTYTMKWDATGMASGIYFYRLQADKFIDTKKILFLK